MTLYEGYVSPEEKIKVLFFVALSLILLSIVIAMIYFSILDYKCPLPVGYHIGYLKWSC